MRLRVERGENMAVGDVLSRPAHYIFTYIIIIVIVNNVLSAKISNERLCGDKECKSILSEVKTLGSYSSKDPQHLSFKRGQIIRVYSKSAGDHPELWGGELDGKHGYFPKTFVREMKIHIQNPKHTLPMESIPPDSASLPNVKEEVKDETEESQVKSETVNDSAEGKDETELSDETELDSEVVDIDETDATEVGTDDDDDDDDDDDNDFPPDDEDDEDIDKDSKLEDGAVKQEDDKVDDTEKTTEAEQKDDTDKPETDTDKKETDTDAQNSDDTDETRTDKEPGIHPDKQDTYGTEPDFKDAVDDEKTKADKSSSKSTENKISLDVPTPDKVNDGTEIDEDETNIDETELPEEESVSKPDLTLPDLSDLPDQEKDKHTESSHVVYYEKLKEEAVEKEMDDLHQRRYDQTDDTTITDKDDVDSLNALLSKKMPHKKDEKDEYTPPLWGQSPQKVVKQPDPLDLKVGKVEKPSPDDKESEKSDDTTEIPGINMPEYLDPNVKTKESDSGGVNQTAPDQPIEPDPTDEHIDPKPKKTVEESHVVKMDQEMEGLGERKDSSSSDELKVETGIMQGKDSTVAGTPENETDRNLPNGPAVSDATRTQPPDSKHPPNGIKDEKSQIEVRASPDDQAGDVEQPDVKNEDLPSGIFGATESSDDILKTEKDSSEHQEEPVVKTMPASSEPSGNFEVFEGTTIYLDDEPAAATPILVITGSSVMEELPSSSTDDGMLPLVRDILRESPPTDSSSLNLDESVFTRAASEVTETLSASEIQVNANLSTGEVDLEAKVEPPVPQANAYHTMDFLSRKTLSHGDQKPSPTPRVQDDQIESASLFPEENHGSDSEGSTTDTPRTEQGEHSPSEEGQITEDQIPATPVNADSAAKGDDKEGLTDNPVKSDKDQAEPEPMDEYRDEKLVETDDVPISADTSADSMKTEADFNVDESVTLPHQDKEEVENGSDQEGAENEKEATATVTETPVDSVEHDSREVSQPVTTPPMETDEKVRIPDDLRHPDQKEDDPYASDDLWTRRITDEKLEEEMYSSGLQSTVKQILAAIEPMLQWLLTKMPPSIQNILEQEPLGFSPQMMLLITMTTMIIMVTVTCCSCVCGRSGRKGRKADPLVVVRGLEEKLFVTTKEKENIEDELQESKRKITKLENQMTNQQKSSGSIQADIQNYRLHNDALRQTVSSLQSDLESYKKTVTQGEINLQDKQEEAEKLYDRIAEMEAYSTSMETKHQQGIKELSEHRNQTENLTAQMEGLNEQVQFLETRKHQLTVEADEWDKKVKDLTETLDQAREEVKEMEENVTFKENELEVLRDCFLQLKTFQDGGGGDETLSGDPKAVDEKMKAMMDVSRVNAMLKASEEELESSRNKLFIETDARKEMEDQIESLKKEVDNLSMDKSKADRTSQDATTRLNVLTAYFKEKEVELQKELGEQETLKKQNVSKLMTADEKTRDMELELKTLRERVKDLQNEITAAERDFRGQIASNEKKAHENWIAARASDREAREARHEASLHRQKLMDLERRQTMGLIRPLPTRGMPPGLPNGPPPLPPMGDRPAFPPGDRPLSRSSMPAFRDDDLRGSPRGPVRFPPPPMDRRPFPPPGMPPLPGMRMPPLRDMRSPPGDMHSPPPYDRRPPRDLRSPPRDMVSPPMFDRRPPPPGYRPDLPPPPHLRDGPPPPRPGQVSPSGRREQDRQGPRTGSPHDQAPLPGREPPPPGREPPPHGREPPPHGRDRPPRQHSQV